MELDGDATFSMEIDNENEDTHTVIKNCKFAMKMKMIECARKQVFMTFTQ